MILGTVKFKVSVLFDDGNAVVENHTKAIPTIASEIKSIRASSSDVTINFILTSLPTFILSNSMNWLLWVCRVMIPFELFINFTTPKLLLRLGLLMMDCIYQEHPVKTFPKILTQIQLTSKMWQNRTQTWSIYVEVYLVIDVFEALCLLRKYRGQPVVVSSRFYGKQKQRLFRFFYQNAFCVSLQLPREIYGNDYIAGGLSDYSSHILVTTAFQYFYPIDFGLRFEGGNK